MIIIGYLPQKVRTWTTLNILKYISIYWYLFRFRSTKQNSKKKNRKKTKYLKKILLPEKVWSLIRNSSFQVPRQGKSCDDWWTNHNNVLPKNGWNALANEQKENYTCDKKNTRKRNKKYSCFVLGARSA